ncbi:MAG: T9SS type A sorting domain-containing protein [Saprospiraceae bacterium]
MKNLFYSPRKASSFNLLLVVLSLFFALSHLAQVKAQSNCTLACNDLIQIAVPPNGSTEFLPDNMLEGDYHLFCPNGIFQAQAQISGIWNPATGNFVFLPIHIGQTFVARVRDTNSGNACFGNVKVVEGAPVSIKDLFVPTQTGLLKLSPNPASHSISLKTSSDAPSMIVRIADMMGRQISQQSLPNGGSLDISSLANGLYSVSATTPSGMVFSTKFRKQD